MSKSLDDEVNRLLAGRVGSALAPLRSAAPSGPELIGLPMNCSVHVLPFVVVNEPDGDTLRMLRNEVPQAVAGGGRYAGPVVSAASLGSFRFDWHSWPGCPHCGTRENPAHDAAGFWLCTGCGSFNCVGADRQGRFRCRCGRIVTGNFSRQAFFDVSGSRIAAAASPVPSTPPLCLPTAAALPRPSAAPWVCGFAASRRPPPPAVKTGAPPIVAPSSGPRLTWKR
jgi:hypothetical protein